MAFLTAGGVPVPAPSQILALYIDNNVPQVKINSIMHGVAVVPTCVVVKMTNPADGVTVNYDAVNAEDNLLSYLLSAAWGDGAAAGIESVTHAIAMGSIWNGVTNKNSALFVPSVTCAHVFIVAAWARTTNGYGRIGCNSASRFITIQKQ